MDEPNFDIRQLKVGGWHSSKIKVKTYGKWAQFTEEDQDQPVNKTWQIDFTKKYNPPKRSRRRKKVQIDLEEQNDKLFIEAFCTSRRSPQEPVEIPKNADGQIKITPEKVPPEDSQSSMSQTSRTIKKTRVSLMESATMPKTSRSALSKTAPIQKRFRPASKTSRVEANRESHVHVVTFDPTEVPTTPRVVRKNRGDDPDKYPFRISTITLRNIASSMNEESPRSPRLPTQMSVRGRARTSMRID